MIIENCDANELDSILRAKAKEYDLPYAYLKSFAIKESGLNPFAVNVDGEGFGNLKSFQDAYTLLYTIQNNRWMCRYTDEGKKVKRIFFDNELSARAFARTVAHKKKVNFNVITANKSADFQSIVVRKLNVVSTDIGVMQINYLFHGKKIGGIVKWFDPTFNIDYACKHLRDLIRIHKNIYKAAAFYHSGSQFYQKKYLNEFIPIYNKQLSKIENPLVSYLPN